MITPLSLGVVSTKGMDASQTIGSAWHSTQQILPDIECGLLNLSA